MQSEMDQEPVSFNVTEEVNRALEEKNYDEAIRILTQAVLICNGNVEQYVISLNRMIQKMEWLGAALESMHTSPASKH